MQNVVDDSCKDAVQATTPPDIDRGGGITIENLDSSQFGSLVYGGMGKLATGRLASWAIFKTKDGYSLLAGAMTVVTPHYHATNLEDVQSGVVKAIADLTDFQQNASDDRVAAKNVL